MDNILKSRKGFLKAVFAIAIPIALQNLLTTTASMVDTMMLGRLSETAVGAVGLCGQFSTLMMSCYWGLLGGGILFFAQYWGAQDEEGIYRSYGMTFVSMMLVSAVFMGLAVSTPQLIMRMYTDKQIYQEAGVSYLRLVGFSYPFQVFSVVAAGLLRSTGKVRIPLFASIASVITNVIMNYALIFGHFGLPAMGISGAAAATVLAAAVNAGINVLMAAVQKYPYLFHPGRMFHWSLRHVKEYFGKSLPIIFNELGLGIAGLIINIVLGRQASSAIAALAVFRTFEGLVIGFFAGFSSASSVMVGNRVGAGELEDAFVIANRIIYLCAATIFSVCALLCCFSSPLLHAMGLAGESAAYGKGMLMIYCFIAVFRMSNWISNDTCRSSGDSLTGTYMEIAFMFLLNIPLLCLAGLVLKFPFLIVFVFSYLDEPIRFVLMQIHMHSGGWIRPVTESGKKALPEFRRKHPLKIFFTRFGIEEESLRY